MMSNADVGSPHCLMDETVIFELTNVCKCVRQTSLGNSCGMMSSTRRSTQESSINNRIVASVGIVMINSFVMHLFLWEFQA